MTRNPRDSSRREVPARCEELEPRIVLSSGILALDSPWGVVDGGSTSSVALAAAPLATTGTYLQVAGAMPVPTSLAWLDWYETLRDAREDYSDQPRAQTYYFSETGSDTTGAGTIGSPFQSLAKAQEVLLAVGGNVALLFKRGDEFTSTTGLNVPYQNVTIGAYGDTNLPKPLLSAFTIQYNAGQTVWTQVAGTNRWTTDAPTRVGWIRDATDDNARLSAFTYLQSTSAVEANPRSWYWSGTTLHFNPGAGVDPNLVNYEAVGDVNDDGIDLSGDGSLVTDIRADGWGAVATKGYQSFGIKVSAYATASVVVRNSEAYYNGRHGISVHGYSTNTGGLSLFLNCTSGYATDTGSGVTIFNTFMPFGGNETIFDNATVRFGKLPDWNLIGGGVDDASPAFYGHGSGVTSLFIVNNSRTIAETLPGATVSSGRLNFLDENLPGNNNDLSSLRALVVGYRVEHDFEKQLTMGSKVVYMNSRFSMDFNGGLEVMGTGSGGGWYINNVFDFRDLTTARRILFPSQSGIGMHFLHNMFWFDGPWNPTNQQNWILISGSNDQNFYAANNLFVRTNTKKFTVGVPNDPFHLIANGYVSIEKTGTEGYDQDPYGVESTSFPLPETGPDPSSPFIGQAAGNPYGYVVEFDFFGNPRNLSAPTLGPVEFDWSSLPSTAAGSSYIVNAGESLSLAPTDPFNPSATYSWDVNGDGVFGDAAGYSPVLTWNQLKALGLVHGHYDLRLRTTIGVTVVDSDPAYLLVRDRLPVVDAGEDQYVFSSFPFSLDASKTYAFGVNENLLFSWDVNGDGVFADVEGETPTVTPSEATALGLVVNTQYSVKVRVFRDFDPTVYVESNPILLFYGPPPVADAGGPYSGQEGVSITLTGSNFGDLPEYAWDLDNDGQYDDAFGSTVGFLAPDQGTYIVGYQVTIDDYVTTDTTTINASNRNPTVVFQGPIPLAAFRGQPISISMYVIDGTADTIAGFTYDVDWDFNGTWDETIEGGSSLVLSRAFNNIGMNIFRVRATDKDGGVSVAAVSYAQVTAHQVVAGTLHWYGTSGDDNVSFQVVGASMRMTETMLNGSAVSNTMDFSGVSKVSVYGQAGNDTLDLTALTTTGHTLWGGAGSDTLRGGSGNETFYGDSDGGEGEADVIYGGAGIDTIYGDGSDGAKDGKDTIDGEDGDDWIYADGGEGAMDSILGGAGNDYVNSGPGSDFTDGGSGNDLILGGDGAEGANDTLLGGDGNDLLFGDVGVLDPKKVTGGLDSLLGGAGQDLIVSGRYLPETAVDVFLLQLEWLSASSYNDRLLHLLGLLPGGINGSTILDPENNVLEDGAVDVVLGDGDLDLIIGNSNQIITE